VAAIASLSGVAFIGIFGGLSYQMGASRDPALGPKARALVAAGQPPSRRIIKRTIIVRKVQEPGPATSGAPVRVQSPPAPVPAPAPVVTKVS
jgi:hypothetical protein